MLGPSNAHWAAVYHAMGLHVWPGYPDPTMNKRPAKASSLRGVKTRFLTQVTTPDDPTEPTGWRHHSWEMVGHVPGLARVPLVALDFDSKDAVTAWVDTAYDARCPVVTSGRGVHVYYRMPDSVASTRPERRPTLAETVIPESSAKVELMCAGKWIVLPPSIHPRTGRPYEWAGAWKDGATRLEDVPLAPDWVVHALRSKPHGSGVYDRAVARAAASITPDDAEVLLRSWCDHSRGPCTPTDTANDLLDGLSRATARHNFMLSATQALVGDIRAGIATCADLDRLRDAFTHSIADRSPADDAAAEFAAMLPRPVAAVHLASRWRAALYAAASHKEPRA